jgi:hypothetical protein
VSEPTTLAGYLDESQLTADVFGTAVDFVLEHIPDVVHPQSVTTYGKMRHDYQVAAVLGAYHLAITRAKWALDPAGCRDEVVEAVANDLGLPILGYLDEEDADNPAAKVMKATGARRRRFRWSSHLELALSLSTTFGHAPFAQQWVEEDGRWRLMMVQERMPQTITAIHLNGDGTLKSAEQGATLGLKSSVQIRTANHELVWYARKREGSNYFGRSLIREAYGPWLMKTDALRRHATAIRRFSMGIPEVQAPPGATPQQILEAQRYASNLGGTAGAGAGVPAGFTTSWKGLTGSVPDAVAFITLLDRAITRSTFTSILDMATAERGNRSLGETVMDLMVYAQQAEAQRIALDGTDQIVIPLVDANWGEDEPAPAICVQGVGADVELTAQDLNWLLEYGGLKADRPARTFIRDRYGIPAEDPSDPVFQTPTEPTPADGGQQ